MAEHDHDPPPRDPAQLFLRLRARRGWTQHNLARALGVTKSQVCNVEQGRRWPSGRVLWAAWGLDAGAGPGGGA